MGQKTSNLKNSINFSINNESTIFNDDNEIITKNSFELIKIIGKGGFGKVWRVRYKKNCKEFAMKEMSKARIIEKNCVSAVLGEREILSQIHHPFIINMIFSFQDENNLYLVMNLFTGGDLRYQMTRLRTFSESQSKFSPHSNFSHLDSLYHFCVLF